MGLLKKIKLHYYVINLSKIVRDVKADNSTTPTKIENTIQVGKKIQIIIFYMNKIVGIRTAQAVSSDQLLNPDINSGHAA